MPVSATQVASQNTDEDRTLARDHLVEREKRERKELDVQRLQLRQPRQRVRIERDDDAADDPGGQIAGPSANQDAAGPAREGQADEHQQVVLERGRATEPQDGRADGGRNDQVLGVRERPRVRIEDVARPRGAAGRGGAWCATHDRIHWLSIASALSWRESRAGADASGQVWTTARSAKRANVHASVAAGRS